MASPGSDTDAALVVRAANGDAASLGFLLNRDRDRLKRMVALRLDRRLQGRVDPSDVVQEAQLEAARRLGEFVARPTMPFFLWLRLIAGQKLLQLHRHHLGVKMRAAGREVSLHRRALPEATSAALADKLLGREAEPDTAAVRAELRVRLQEALNAMDGNDREVLVLRHFEHLTTAEAAAELEITEEAAKKRHLRALKRLKEILGGTEGGAP
ncbi:MAG TPA: sigma-70 family RNA polymerase sigma factor [Gemmataceae bacterium]|jgi:RNA polymerase sigma-70 factor (ECF subfamily)|nr:sigma-70 family RNA polymerase sigma factor [Gemmataceae bacterium]